MRKKIAISCGDPAGIGYEVVAKSLPAFAESDFDFVLFGAAGIFKRLAEKFDWVHRFWDMVRGGRFEFVDLGGDSDFPVGRIDPRCGEVAFKSILAAAQTCLRGEAKGLVTAPVSKRAIQLAGHPDFFGHTEFLGKIFGAETTMMLFSGNFRVALVTTHIPIRRVPDFITAKNILPHLVRTDDALRRWFGIKSPKIGVLALNPHAGESGAIGDEETEISAAIDSARRRGISAEGPLVPDVAFLPALRERYDAYLAMYHDQGLIPLKTLGFDTGVNITLGLPVPRTSPDHGTAYDIAGKGIANPQSFSAAVRTVMDILKNLQ